MEKEMPLYDGNKEYVKQNENENTTDVYCKRFLDNDKKAISVKVSKFDNRADFLKFFVEGMEFFIKELTHIEKNIFVYAMMKCSYRNNFSLNSDFRRNVQMFLGISQGAVSKAIKGLIEKEIFVRLNPKTMKKEELNMFFLHGYETKEYVLNPNIVGKGSLKDLLGMKRVIRQEYNFTNFEGKETIEEYYAY